ncbi:MAG: hypothetical protein AABY14_01015, partial [Nanoarchaeota archaeon]
MADDWRTKGWFSESNPGSKKIIAERKQKWQEEKQRKEKKEEMDAQAQLARQQKQQQAIKDKQEKIASRQKEEFNTRLENHPELYNYQYFLSGLSDEKQVRMTEFLEMQKQILAIAHHYIPSSNVKEYNTLETLLFYLTKKTPSIDDAVERIGRYLQLLSGRELKTYLINVERLPPKVDIDNYVRIIHNLANIVNIYAEAKPTANIGMIGEGFFSDGYYPLAIMTNIEDRLARIYGKKSKDELEDITEALTSEKNLSKYLFRLVGSLNEILSKDILNRPSNFGLSGLPTKKKPAISEKEAENLLIAIESQFGVKTDTSTSPFFREYYEPTRYLEILIERCDDLGLFSYTNINYRDIKSREEIEGITRKMGKDIPIFEKTHKILEQIYTNINSANLSSYIAQIDAKRLILGSLYTGVDSQIKNLEATESALRDDKNTTVIHYHLANLNGIRNQMKKQNLGSVEPYKEIVSLISTLSSSPPRTNAENYDEIFELFENINRYIKKEKAK